MPDLTSCFSWLFRSIKPRADKQSCTREGLFHFFSQAVEVGNDAENFLILERIEAIEVIRWYQHFIYVKLMRAVRGELDERDEELDDLPKDSDGSAKIALIAIDRSIGAWGTIYGLDSFQNEKILRFIAYLDRLREEVEKTFPGARSFTRPGFD